MRSRCLIHSLLRRRKPMSDWVLSPRWDLITKVMLFKLNDKPDRRGTIATFKVKDIPNKDLARMEGIGIVQYLVPLLKDIYTVRSSTLGQESEENDAWITFDHTKNEASLLHKYWGNDDVDLFRTVV